MDWKLKRKWIKAMRSGKYKKGNILLRGFAPDSESFCAQGVLLDILDPEGWNSLKDKDVHKFAMGASAIDWDKRRELGITDRDHFQISMINDKSETFEPVIEYIQENM